MRIGVEIIDKTLIRCAHWFAEATTITERSLGGQETGFEEQRGPRCWSNGGRVKPRSSGKAIEGDPGGGGIEEESGKSFWFFSDW